MMRLLYLRENTAFYYTLGNVYNFKQQKFFPSVSGRKMNNNVKISYSQYVVDGLLPYGGYVN